MVTVYPKSAEYIKYGQQIQESLSKLGIPVCYVNNILYIFCKPVAKMENGGAHVNLKFEEMNVKAKNGYAGLNGWHIGERVSEFQGYLQGISVDLTKGSSSVIIRRPEEGTFIGTVGKLELLSSQLELLSSKGSSLERALV